MPSIDGGESSADEALAPVIPLFGRDFPSHDRGDEGRSTAGRRDQGSSPSSAPRHSSLGGRRSGPVFRPDDDEAAAAPEKSEQEVQDAAEQSLLRKLRSRQLSVSESRGVLLGAGVGAEAADEVLERFERLGYLDDAGLADQLVRSAVERKGQGRQAISPLLSRRGIPRDVIDGVVSAMPDDDLDRALEFARTKARSLGSRDYETALRRLLGQLARRGYPSSVAMTAARQALDEL